MIAPRLMSLVILLLLIELFKISKTYENRNSLNKIIILKKTPIKFEIIPTIIPKNISFFNLNSSFLIYQYPHVKSCHS